MKTVPRDKPLPQPHHTLQSQQGLRQSMAWLHTWTGLVLCWLLLLIFAAGTSSYYREEITLWMQPELHQAIAAPVGSADAAERVVATLQQRAPDASQWFINLPEARTPSVRTFWSIPVKQDSAPGDKPKKRGGKRFDRATFDPATGVEIHPPRETAGGEFLYRLHFDLHYLPPMISRWIVGIAAMSMLVAIVSGVITHKRIFKDFFTFRRKKGQRSWLDAHNAAAVLALPFHLMITFTGMVTLMFMYMPWAAQVAYKGNRDLMVQEVFQVPAQDAKAAGTAARLTPIRPLVEQAMAHWNGARIGRVIVSFPNDANATISIGRAAPDGDSSADRGARIAAVQPSMLFNGVTGALISATPDMPPPASATRSTMYALHMAEFAGPVLRALFFLSGLGGCAMVATGALLWAVKVRQQRSKRIAAGAGPGFGLRLVEALNIGAIAGLPIAFGAYFWANRLLPLGMEKRPDAEIGYFFLAWGAAALLAQIRPGRRMWQCQLWVGAALLGGIPLLNAATTDTHLGVTLLMGRGPAAVAGFDLVTLLLGLGLAYAALTLGRRGGKLKTAARAGTPPTAGALRPARADTDMGTA